MAKDSIAKRGWIHLGIEITTILIVATLAWGKVTADLSMTKYRVAQLEQTMKIVAESTTSMALDIREIKTLVKTETAKKLTE